jgi:beta-carotene 3-hydroxylase
MVALLGPVVALAVAVLMEGVAHTTHRYAMHGFLWVLHEDHHCPTGRGLQKNDLFAVFFATIAMLLLYFGVMQRLPVLAAAGVGMTLYGLGYFLFHDIMFHRRLRGVHLRANTPYLRRIVRAHQVHHRNSGKDRGTSFGFLYASKRYDQDMPLAAKGVSQ